MKIYFIFSYSLWRFIPLKFDFTMCMRTYKHIYIRTHISITVKAVGIKYKNATNLQSLLSLKWAILLQLKKKDAIFLPNFFRFVLIMTRQQLLSTFWFFPILFFFEEMQQSWPWTQFSQFTPIPINGALMKGIMLIRVSSFDIFKQYEIFKQCYEMSPSFLSHHKCWNKGSKDEWMFMFLKRKHTFILGSYVSTFGMAQKGRAHFIITRTLLSLC